MAHAAPLVGTLQDSLARAFLLVLKHTRNSTEAEFKMLGNLAGMFPGGHGAITMHAIAKATGLSRRSVQSASRGLALRKLIRIAPGRGPKPPTFHLDFLLAESTLANSAPLAESTLANSAPLAESTLANSAPLAESTLANSAPLAPPSHKERARAPGGQTDSDLDSKVRPTQQERQQIANEVFIACGEPMNSDRHLDSIVENGRRRCEQAVLIRFIHWFVGEKRARKIQVNPGLIEKAVRENDLPRWLKEPANEAFIAAENRKAAIGRQRTTAIEEMKNPEDVERENRILARAVANPDEAGRLLEQLNALRKARGASA